MLHLLDLVIGQFILQVIGSRSVHKLDLSDLSEVDLSRHSLGLSSELEEEVLVINAFLLAIVVQDVVVGGTLSTADLTFHQQNGIVLLVIFGSHFNRSELKVLLEADNSLEDLLEDRDKVIVKSLQLLSLSLQNQILVELQFVICFQIEGMLFISLILRFSRIHHGQTNFIL